MAARNEEIAVVFEEIADLLDIENANPFRVRAYRNAARTVRGLSHEIVDLLANGKDPSTLPGIGKDLSAKIREIVETGQCALLNRLHRETPVSVEALLKLPGLGPKRVRHLYHELDIQNLEQLEKAARNGKLRALPGFGAKLEQSILENIRATRSKEKRFLRSVAERCADSLLQHLKQCRAVKQARVAGSYRRGKDSVGDLDILVIAKDSSQVMEHFVSFDEADQIVSKGNTRATVVLRSGLQVDLRVVDEESYGSALHYFTGSKAHNIRIRRIAQQRGLKINEYGVYRGDRRIAGDTEESVFDSVGLPWIAPELRENRGEIEAALDGELPRLIEIRDIKGDLHSHTIATDGRATIEAMALAAREHGLEYLAITDHSRHLTVAHGLHAEQLARQSDEIDRLNEEIKGITLLKSVEVDILEDGTLDLPDPVLAKLDLVVAAVHSQFHLSRKKQSERILKAMDSRYFTILAHPTGRLLLDREPYDLDIKKTIAKARERGCFLELNSQPRRLDLNDIDCRSAMQEGVLISINSDAHNENDFQNLRYGIGQARRAWIQKKDVLNTLSLKNLRPILRQTMA